MLEIFSYLVLFVQYAYQSGLRLFEDIFGGSTYGQFDPSRSVWFNFNRKVKYAVTKDQYLTPRSLDEIKYMVRDCVSKGFKIRPVGSGHSFNDVVLKSFDGKVISLREHYNKILRVDTDNKIAIVQAGIQLRNLCHELEKYGLGIHNMGNYYQQTVGGVISTGTHGTTGRNLDDTFTSILVKVEIVTAQGGVIELDPKNAISLGGLGIIHQVAIQCVDMYWLKHEVTPVPRILDYLVPKKVEKLLKQNDFVFFRWITTYHAGERATMETFNKVHDKRLVTPIRNIITQTRLILKYWILTPYVNAIPSFILRFFIHYLGPILPHRRVDAYYLAYAVPGVVASHIESEWALDRSRLEEVMQYIYHNLENLIGQDVAEIHIRFAPPDEAWLAPAYNRDTVFLDFNIADTDVNLESLSAKMYEFGARPHWSKLHNLTSKEIATLGYNFKPFEKLRNTYDPDRVFQNPYIQRVFPDESYVQENF